MTSDRIIAKDPATGREVVFSPETSFAIQQLYNEDNEIQPFHEWARQAPDWFVVACEKRLEGDPTTESVALASVIMAMNQGKRHAHAQSFDSLVEEVLKHSIEARMACILEQQRRCGIVVDYGLEPNGNLFVKLADIIDVEDPQKGYDRSIQMHEAWLRQVRHAS